MLVYTTTTADTYLNKYSELENYNEIKSSFIFYFQELKSINMALIYTKREYKLT